jgi:hypothetical protein
MVTTARFWICCALTLLLAPLPALSQSAPATATASTAHVASAVADGNHDFDFNFGTWHTHIRRLLHPLSGSNSWSELDGTVAVRKLWGGKAQLEEIEADGASGHFEGLTLFLFDSGTRQWSMYFVNTNSGVLDTPAIGAFKDGRGVFYAQDTLKGRGIQVRTIWSAITPTTHHLEQSFSDDGGKTWEANFIADLAATRDTPKVPEAFADPAQHDFDWQLGSWKIHMQRMLHPLSSAESWTTYDGRVDVSRIWNGRANVAEINTTGPTGHLEFLSLRLYNPQSHQWTLNFAHLGSGEVGSPMYGQFKEGRGVFYDVEPLEGRPIIARFVFDSVTASSGRDEQAFSADGGKTWEVNWVNLQTRVDQPSTRTP